MKFKEIDDVKGYMHTMFKGEALVFRGCLYVWNGEDLVWHANIIWFSFSV